MSKQKGVFEKFVSDFQRQVLADRAILPNAKVVAVVISLHFNRENFNQGRPDLAFCGIGALAQATGLDRRTVMRAIQELERRGHFEVTRKRIGKRNLANRYIPLKIAASSSQRTSVKRPDNGVHHLVSPVTHLVSPLSP